MSCHTEYLQKQLLIFFENVVFVVLDCVQLLWWFSHKPSEKQWAISPKGKHQLSKMTLSTFQKCVFELCLAFFFGCNWKICFENLLRSLLGTICVFCSNAESRFGWASFRRLGLVLWLFTSCVWDVLRYRILIKTAFDFFRNVVCVASYCVQLLYWVSSKPSEKYWAISPKGKHKLSKTTFSTFQIYLFELRFAFSFGGNYKNCFETFLRSLLGKIRVFCSNAESRFGCASSRRLRLVLWLFSSCVWDVLWYRILIKTAVSWAKQTFQNDVEYVPKMSFWTLVGLLLWL